MIVEVVEGSSTVRVVEEAAAVDAVAMTTRAVVEKETAGVAVESSGQGGGSSNHCAGKGVAADVPSGGQGKAAATESEEEEYFNFCSEFFGPASIVGSSAFKSRDRVPHPKDIPNRGDIFNDERLEKVWWDRVDKMDGLKNPTSVVSMFARTSMNVSI